MNTTTKFAAAMLSLWLAGSAALAAVDYQANLAKIPPADPAATNAPQIVPALHGKHPRLLFTTEEIAAEQKAIDADPVLSKTKASLLAWGERFKLQPESPKPQIVLNDTAALTTSVNHNVGLVYAYALGHSPKVRDGIISVLKMMLDQPYWADTAELDSNMGAGNNMLMVGLMFDAVYNDLDPQLRHQLAEKMLTHVRRMYYLGFKEGAIGVVKYWQQDPQNNHRWHRNAGMAACLLAIADEPGIDAGYLLEQRKAEVDFIHKWYPPDGDCHEGAGYQQFGFLYQAINAIMMDRVLGTHYLESPGLKNAWAQQIYFGTPGRASDQSFGDDMNGDTWFNHLDAAFFIGPKLTRDANVQAALVHRMEIKRKRPDNRPVEYPWSVFAFYDPTLKGGDYTKLPTARLFADLGAASMRDSWEDNAALLTFKCGPYGGYKLNEYAEAVPGTDGKKHYVNVAHDDPDQNGFSLSVAGNFIFHPGLYSLNKRTESASTITVDGKGQRNEGSDFTQPIPDVDMRTLAYLTAWKTEADGKTIVEGEAGKLYAGLKQFRRTVIWLPGQYGLILDNVRTDGSPHTITWRGTVEKGQFDKPEDGWCHAYTRSGGRVDFQMLADQPFTGAIDYCYLDGRFGGQLMQQFQFAAKTDAVHYACLLDPWKKKPEMTLASKDGVVTLTVKNGEATDTWTWPEPADADTPTLITGERAGQPIVKLTAADKALRGD